MKIIHFFIDEKFTEFMISLFDKIGGHENLYVLVDDRNSSDLSYGSKYVNVVKLNQVNEEVKKSKPDLIIFHSLFHNNLKTLNTLDANCKICWFSWGGDIAIETSIQIGTIHEKNTLDEYYNYNVSSRFKEHFFNFFKIAFPTIYNNYYKYRTGENWNNYVLKKNIHKIDIVSTVIYSEQTIFKKNGFSGKFIHIPVGSMEYLIDGIDITKSYHKELSNSIFIAHSAYSENNQLEVFLKLKDYNYSGHIYCPLSYGDKKYSSFIVNKGTEFFGSNFVSIMGYLGKSDYFGIINNCDCFINNSIIQQGLGNILVAIYFGKPVFLNHKGKIYEFLKELGIEVFSIENDFPLFLRKKLTLGTTTNLDELRAKIDKVYSEPNVLNNIRAFLLDI